MNIFQILSFLFSFFTIALTESFCNDYDHSGESIELDANKKGNVGPVDYELWANGGNNSATFFTDGSFSCGFKNTTDYLCRSGINIIPAKLPSEIGHIKAEFKVEKVYFENVQYSYIGVYGWTLGSGISDIFVFEYYIVDDVLVPIPSDFANEMIGDFIIDGAEYTVYRNTKGMLLQYFSVRKEPRSCGTIDVTAHFEQWEKLGFEMGKISEVKVLGEAGNDFGNVYGVLEFPYAKVYIDGEVAQSQAYTTIIEPDEEPTTIVEEPVEEPTTIIDEPVEEPVEEPTIIIEEPVEEPVEEPTIIIEEPVEEPTTAVVEGFCNGYDHSGESIELDANKKGNVGPVDYELWANGGNNSATFFTDGSFSCGFKNTTDYLCRSGINIIPAKLPSEIGHIKAEFKVEKVYFENVQYSYIGVYGWTLGSGISDIFVFEYYIVDDVLVPIPSDFANEMIGDFIIDGAEYTVYRNTKGMLLQYFSVRKEPRSCGTIDVTAHFEQWEKLGFEMGKISEVKVLGEAGNDFGNVYGALEFPYAKVYIDGEVAQSQAYTTSIEPDEESTTIVDELVEEPTTIIDEPVEEPVEEPTTIVVEPVVKEPTIIVEEPVEEPTTVVVEPVVEEPTTAIVEPIVEEPTTTIVEPEKPEIPVISRPVIPFAPKRPIVPTAPKVVAPKAVAPKAVAPKAVAPKAVAPKVIAPKIVAPKRISRKKTKSIKRIVIKPKMN